MVQKSTIQLMKEISEMKNQLYYLIEIKELCDQSVIKLSQQIDNIIIQYYK